MTNSCRPRAAKTVNGMAEGRRTSPRKNRQNENPDRRPKDWSPEEKLQAALGSWLRSRCLYNDDIDALRRAVSAALADEGKAKECSGGAKQSEEF